MIGVTSADGTTVQILDEGQGPPILVLHPGLDDGATWARVAGRLADRYRVLRLHRRPYRVDLPSDPRAAMAREVEDVQAVVAATSSPRLLVGHSSGAVVALETLVALPGAFAGAVLYEPPCVIGPPLGGAPYERAKAAIRAGRPGKAMQVFVTQIVRERALPGPLIRLFVALRPRFRSFAPRQVDEVLSIDLLGNRLDAHAAIDAPVLLLGGDRSPAHLAERMDALQRVLPHVDRVTLRGQGHLANQRAPGEVARVISDFAARVLPARGAGAAVAGAAPASGTPA